jgi:UDP-galactopyranose mutase
MKVDNIIVGCGIAGIVLARRLAEEKNETVLIIDKKNHIGGNCYDYRDESGILIHKYGPHIFRTDSRKVYEYLSRFTEWYDYQHKVLAYANGHLYPMPINLDTVNGVLGTNYDTGSVMEYFDKNKIAKDTINNVEDVIVSQIGKMFYETFFEKYTAKQWGLHPTQLPKEIVARIPIRSNRDDRYFTVKYQGIPSEGYTQMMTKMLDHPKIKILLQTEYRDIKDSINADRVYYSGAIDEYYDYCYGELPYRCVYFKFEKFECEYFQSASVVNYPNDYDYTRITEFKHFTNHKSANTVIAKEYPSDKGEPSYPIPIEENKKLYEKYLKLNENSAARVLFIGRLGEYKYYSMDEIILKILMVDI